MVAYCNKSMRLFKALFIHHTINEEFNKSILTFLKIDFAWLPTRRNDGKRFALDQNKLNDTFAQNFT